MEAIKDIIVKMMVEVLGVFTIMMKEMKEGRTSESIPDDTFSVTDRALEKYFKKFITKLKLRKDRIQDALIRMDGLTSQEVATAIAQIRSTVDRSDHGEGRTREDIEVNTNVNEGTFDAPTTHKILTHIRLADKETKVPSSGHPLSPLATSSRTVVARGRSSESVSCHSSKPHYKRLSSDCPTQPLLAGTASTIHSDPAPLAATTRTASSSSDRPTQPLLTGTANTIHLDPSPLIAADATYNITPTASSSLSESNLKAIFEKSLEEYKEKTEVDLRTDPLMAKLQNCDTLDDFLTVLDDHVGNTKKYTSGNPPPSTFDRLRGKVEKFKKSTSDDIKWTKWLKPIVHVLHAFSSVAGTSVAIVNLIHMILLRSIL